MQNVNQFSWFTSNLINSFHKYLFWRYNVRIQDITVRWLKPCLVISKLSLSLCHWRQKILKLMSKIAAGVGVGHKGYAGQQQSCAKKRKPLPIIPDQTKNCSSSTISSTIITHHRSPKASIYMPLIFYYKAFKHMETSPNPGNSTS